AVLLFGVWDWQGGQARAQAYHEGVAAVAARHWEQARVAFVASGDYADAPARLKAATAEVRSLADRYAGLLSAADQGDWLRAYRLARAVAADEPDYRDVAREQERAYQALFYGPGVSGVVFLQAMGPRPG